MAGQDVQYTLSLRDLLTGKLNEANTAATKLETTMTGVQSILGALGVAGGIAGVFAFGRAVVEAGTKVEDARVGLTTLLKDADEAGGVIKKTMEDATKTPFAFEGLLNANKALISAGENSVKARENVLNLANAIAATGGGDDELQRMVVNLQQIRNTGVATALDIKQFAFAGINIYKALDAAGVKHGENQQVTYEQITFALKKAHEACGIYYNGLENMAKNTSVQLSNLKDGMFQLSVKIFDDLKPAISGLISGLNSFIVSAREVWDWTVKNKEVIKELAFDVGILIGAYATYNFWQKAVVAWQTLQYMWMMRTVIAESLLESATLALNAAMNANPIGLLVVAISGYLMYINTLKDSTGEAIGIFQHLRDVINDVKLSFQQMGTGLAMIWQGITERSLSTIKEGTKMFWEGLSSSGGQSEANRISLKIKGQEDSETIKPTFGNKKATGATTADGQGAVKSIAPKSAGSSVKAVTVNINIGKLIEQFKIETTNVTESADKIKELVANTILQAVNDASLVSNI